MSLNPTSIRARRASSSHYNNLIDRFSAVSDTSAEVCELISTQFCSSKFLKKIIDLYFTVIIYICVTPLNRKYL